MSWPTAPAACSPPSISSSATPAAAAGRRTWSITCASDATGALLETCDRDGERENYLAPKNHLVVARLAGAVPPGATCNWSFDDGTIPPKQVNAPCAAAGAAAPRLRQADHRRRRHHAARQQRRQRVGRNRGPRSPDRGLGDSVAAGEGNPDRPVALADEGFCFRRFLGAARSEYFRPSRQGYDGDKACDDNPGRLARLRHATGTATARAGCRRPATARCTAISFAPRSRSRSRTRHAAVTFLPLACSGRDDRARPVRLAGRQRLPAHGPLRRHGAAADRAVAGHARQGPQAAPQPQARPRPAHGRRQRHQVLRPRRRRHHQRRRRTHAVQPGRPARDRAAGASHPRPRLSRTASPSSAPRSSRWSAAICPASSTCPMAIRRCRATRPAPAAATASTSIRRSPPTDARLKNVTDFVLTKFLPRVKALARCEAGSRCANPDTDRMTFVDAHQAEFADHGICARSPQDPEFDRECFSPEGNSFDPDPVSAPNAPLVCPLRPSEFRPYAPRARWIRTANDSYFTAMTYPRGLPVDDAAEPTSTMRAGARCPRSMAARSIRAPRAMPRWPTRRCRRRARRSASSAPPEVIAQPLPPPDTTAR